MPAVTACPRCRCDVAADPDPATGVVVCEHCATPFDPGASATAIAESPATADAQPAAGGRCGPYELIERIGEGGMSEVWRARQPGLRREVAIKRLRPQFAADADLRRRFAREGDALKRLDHPHILAVIDAGEDDAGRPYLMMPLAGHSLRAAMNDGRGEPLRIEPRRLLAYAEQIADGLEHAHARGLVHRDVKPENLLIDTEDRIRIADFGIAHLLPAPEFTALTQLTRTGQVLGTMAYIAPEQAEGRAVDRRADYYSLGVICYEALTGHRPIGRFEDPADHLDLPPRRKAAWNRLVLALLHRDPDRRPATAAELRGLIDGVRRAETAKVDAAATDDDGEPADEEHRWPHGRSLNRSPDDKIFGGVCGGLAAWTGVHPIWVRLLFLIALFASFGFFLLAYLLGVILIPQCPDRAYRPKPLNHAFPARPWGWFFGVCEGLARRSHTEPWIWRLIAVLTIPFGSIVVYLLLAIVLPPAHRQRAAPPLPAPADAQRPNEPLERRPRRDPSAFRFWAVLLGTLLFAFLIPAQIAVDETRREADAAYVDAIAEMEAAERQTREAAESAGIIEESAAPRSGEATPPPSTTAPASGDGVGSPGPGWTDSGPDTPGGGGGWGPGSGASAGQAQGASGIALAPLLLVALVVLLFAAVLCSGLNWPRAVGTGGGLVVVAGVLVLGAFAFQDRVYPGSPVLGTGAFGAFALCLLGGLGIGLLRSRLKVVQLAIVVLMLAGVVLAMGVEPSPRREVLVVVLAVGAPFAYFLIRGLCRATGIGRDDGTRLDAPSAVFGGGLLAACLIFGSLLTWGGEPKPMKSMGPSSNAAAEDRRLELVAPGERVEDAAGVGSGSGE